MNKTPNYQLNQWDKSDRIQMEDFNADNAKIEAALASQSQAISGMLKVASGTYVGTGVYNTGNETTLTFDITPLAIIITADISGNTSGGGTVFLAGQSRSSGLGNNYNGAGLGIVATWGTNSLSWYSYETADRQLNKANTTYHYLVLGV